MTLKCPDLPSIDEPGRRQPPALESLELSSGEKLFYRSYAPIQKSNKAIIIFHRGHEHSGRLKGIIEELCLPDAWIFAWDARGHGNTEAKLESYAQVLEDMNLFLNEISRKYEIPFENMLLAAHSFSSPALMQYLQEYNDRINSVVLVSPAFKINLFVPFAMQGLNLLRKIDPQSRITSYVSGSMLTRCKREARIYDSDKSISRDISVEVLLGLHECASNVIDRAEKTKTATLMLLAGDDYIADPKEQMRFFKTLGSEEKQMKVYEKMRHDIFHEKNRLLAAMDIRSFARQRLWKEN